MTTAKQNLGDRGEKLIRKKFNCFKCKKKKPLKPLMTNFKCADLICDFCGYLAQVKTNKVDDINIFPKIVPSAAWAPQKERMDAGIFFPIFFVFIEKRNHNNFSIFYLPADLQGESMFVKRKPLKSSAIRAGWQGYNLIGQEIEKYATRLS